MLICIGVLVSPSAKKARARMLTVENATSPGARHISARRRALVESAVNLPCSNSSRTIGSASTTSRMAGNQIRQSSVPRPCRSVARNSE
jgi:hypothetical protein